jgi:hypothetical protein
MGTLKGGEDWVGRDCAVGDIEVAPCVTVDEAVWFADLFGGPLANSHFAICQTWPNCRAPAGVIAWCRWPF